MPGICSALKAEIWDGVRPATDEKKKKKGFKYPLDSSQKSYI